MANYALPSLSKAHREIEKAVSEAVEQVTGASTLEDYERLEYAYLMVREKLDRMENSEEYDHLDVGVSDAVVCEAVLLELAKRIGLETEIASLNKSYPEDLPSIAMHGLALVQ